MFGRRSCRILLDEGKGRLHAQDGEGEGARLALCEAGAFEIEHRIASRVVVPASQ